MSSRSMDTLSTGLWTLQKKTLAWGVLKYRLCSCHCFHPQQRRSKGHAIADSHPHARPALAKCVPGETLPWLGPACGSNV